MNKKQKLKNAVILGLLMSSAVSSSVLAATDWIKDGWHYTDVWFIAEGTYREWASVDGNPADITISHDDRLAGLKYGIWSHSANVAWENAGTAIINDLKNIDINIKNCVPDIIDFATPETISVGILAGAENGKGNENGLSKSEVNASENVKINVLTRNSQNAYGAYAKKNGTVNVNSDNGYISINSSKSLDKEYIGGIYYGEIADTNYASDVYGVSAVDGNVSLNAKAGDIVINSYIEDVSHLAGEKNYKENFEELQQGNIYGVSNVNGTVDLTAGNTISITANSANGNAYGIYADSDKTTILNSNYNEITAIADGNGTAQLALKLKMVLK